MEVLFGIFDETLDAVIVVSWKEEKGEKAEEEVEKEINNGNDSDGDDDDDNGVSSTLLVRIAVNNRKQGKNEM